MDEGRIPPAILVMPDAFTRLGGSQYVNSSAVGRYEDYVAQVLVDVANPTPENPDATTQQVLTDNVADAEIYGFELETNLDLPWNLNLNASLLWLDSEFDDSAIVDARQNANPVISVDGNELPNVTLAMDETVELAVSGNVALDAFGFVQVFGGIAFSKSTFDVTLTGGATKTVDVMTFGLDDIDVFVGAGPYFVDSDFDGFIDDDGAKGNFRQL